MADYS